MKITGKDSFGNVIILEVPLEEILELLKYFDFKEKLKVLFQRKTNLSFTEKIQENNLRYLHEKENLEKILESIPCDSDGSTIGFTYDKDLEVFKEYFLNRANWLYNWLDFDDNKQSRYFEFINKLTEKGNLEFQEYLKILEKKQKSKMKARQ